MFRSLAKHVFIAGCRPLVAPDDGFLMTLDQVAQALEAGPDKLGEVMSTISCWRGSRASRAGRATARAIISVPAVISKAPDAEKDLQIPSTVTSGGVKSLKPNLGQSHLVSNLVFGSWR